MPDFPSEMLIFGCGNMGGAMLRGWLRAGVEPSRFIVVDPLAVGLPEGVFVHRSAAEVNRQFGTVLLGIKPQMLGDAGSRHNKIARARGAGHFDIGGV